MARSFYVAYSYKLVDKFSKKATAIGASVKKLGQSLARLRVSTVKSSRNLKAFSSEMSSKVKLPVLAASASLFIFNKRFSDSMNAMQADAGILDRTGEKFVAMRKLAMELGSTTQFSASEAAQGLRELSRAGLAADDAMAALPHTLNLAAAGGLALGEASDIATNIKAAFTLDISDLVHVNDVLAFTASNSTTNIREIAQALAYGGGVANAAGIKIEETSAFLATLAESSIRGSMAGTSLKEAINGLLIPSKKAQDIFKKLGIASTEISADGGRTLKDFTGVMTRLAEANLTAADTNSIFGERGSRVMNSFAAKMKKSKTFTQDFAEQLKKVDGTAKAMASTRMQGLPGALKEAVSAFEGMNLAIGDAGLNGILISVLKTAAKFFRKVSSASPLVKRLMMATLALAAAFAFLLPVLIGVGIAVQFITWPITLITLGILALTAAIVAIIVYWKEIVAWMKKYRNYILLVLGPLGGLIRIGTLLVAAWKPFRDMLSSIASFLDKIISKNDKMQSSPQLVQQQQYKSLSRNMTDRGISYTRSKPVASKAPIMPYNITSMTQALINQTPMATKDSKLNGTINISAPPGIVSNAELDLDVPGNLGFNMSGAGAF